MKRVALATLRSRSAHAGHTPEHISIVVREPNQPARVLTGDTLFVGAVGRPDLLGADQARDLAGQLHESLFTQLLPLGDDVEVHPGHGAGSLCGSGIGNEPHSTIGRERRFNPLLQLPSASDFVAAVLNDLPDTPPYFPRMKVINRDGPAVLGLTAGVSAPVPVPPRDAATKIEQGALLIDLRSADAFGAGHPAGAINVGFSARVGYWAGWILAPDAQLLILGSETQATKAPAAPPRRARCGRNDRRRLRCVERGGRTGGAPRADQRARAHRAARPRAAHDRRRPDGSVARRSRRSIAEPPLGELPARAGALRGAEPVPRSAERLSLESRVELAARAGFRVVSVTDGTSAYRALAGC